MRVLISAYACEPGIGSEPGVGWIWAKAAAQEHQVTLVTRSNNSEAIEAAIAKGGLGDCIEVVYLDLPICVLWLKRRFGLVHLYYFCWQLVLGLRMRKLCRRYKVDVVHHLTFATSSMLAATIAVKDLPVIWGPVGGSAPFLPRLALRLGPRVFFSEVLRWSAVRAGERLFGFPQARRARLTIAQNDSVAQRFRKFNPIVEPNAAVDPLASSKHPKTESGIRTAVFVGRLVAFKGASLCLRAIADPRCSDWRLVIIGAGPELGTLKRLAERLNIADRVEFLGQVAHEEVLAVFGKFDALLFPSLHDSAGTAVAEALANGVPVICLDICGPRVLVKEGMGVRVSPKGDVVTALGTALREVPPRFTPTDQWSAERLPGVLNCWYQHACQDPKVAR